MTNSTDPAVAVLQSQMATVSDTVGRIETKLDAFNAQFVTKDEFTEFKKRWAFSHVIVALVSSVCTGLIIYFITQGVK